MVSRSLTARLSRLAGWLPRRRPLDYEPTKSVFAQLVENSVLVPQTEMLASFAREFGVVLSLGVNERVREAPGHGTLYNSNLLFNSDRTLVNCHRKIMPTFTGRMIWGMDDGTSLRAADTAAGRIGGSVPSWRMPDALAPGVTLAR